MIFLERYFSTVKDLKKKTKTTKAQTPINPKMIFAFLTNTLSVEEDDNLSLSNFGEFCKERNKLL